MLSSTSSFFACCSTMPKLLLGMSSSTPPTLVTMGTVPHAAASKSDVEKPSERVGRQKASEASRRAATSGGAQPSHDMHIGQVLLSYLLLERAFSRKGKSDIAVLRQCLGCVHKRADSLFGDESAGKRYEEVLRSDIQLLAEVSSGGAALELNGIDGIAKRPLSCDAKMVQPSYSCLRYSVIVDFMALDDAGEGVLVG